MISIKKQSEGAGLSEVASLLVYLHALTMSNPELGRKGPVCPYTSLGLRVDSFYFSVIKGQQELDVRRAIAGSLQPFRRLAGELTQKALFLLFPDLAGDSLDLLDKTHKELKIHFVRKGLMLGVFHPREVSGGLHNESFHPSVCEIPMAVVRNMVAGDRVFFEKAFEKNPDDLIAAESLKIHQSFFPESYLENRKTGEQK